MEEFQKLLEDYFSQTERTYQTGEKVKGIIVHMDDKHAYVDIGTKKEALLPLDELKDFEGNFLFKRGDEISALIIKKLSGDASYLLSLRKLLEEEIKEELKEAYERGNPIRVRLLKPVKGGFEVTYRGILKGFLPKSQYQGSEDGNIVVIIIKFDERSFVVSQRAYLEREREFKLKELMSLIEKEGILDGRIKKEVKGGYLVEFEGVLTGYLPFEELTRRRLSSYEGFLSEGENIRVKVIQWNPETKKLRLSLKALEPDPWDEASFKYAVDQRVKGKVVKVMNFGAFVEIEPGLEGLLPASEISWKRGLKPKDVLSEGNIVEVVINEFDPKEKKMILSLKRLEENPWERIAKEVKIGDIVEGKVKTITSFGIFVEIIEGVDGFLPKSQVDWDRVEDLNQIYSVGDKVRAKIIEFDPEKKKLLLSIKELLPNPWEEISSKVKVGDDIEGVIMGEAKGQGYFVRISKGVVGFLPVKEIWKEGEKQRVLKEGENIKGKVILFDPQKKRLWISERAYFKEKEEKELLALKESYKGSSRSLKDILKLNPKESE